MRCGVFVSSWFVHGVSVGDYNEDYTLTGDRMGDKGHSKTRPLA